ncbi:dihydrofolate reductase [Aggregicoccus sp. 17bor-14]|uniref:dihydrofolate reductase n=1 Tax=Myxococcaceae TaxID=31 RepID=UPI00129CE16E|nr:MULTISPECIES: dihydrofolate reductase [Myxococcaceae]MBF5044563.1 dihydrofolate reductase [Simulacricoccus sp. 17bor-14]MRI90308.1 dihydrofolate reductase [Aggregicoccus sp. 17bor-14]
MRRSALVAMARNRVIGRDNALPWRLPADLARFKRLTMGHTLVLGRKTYESIGRPLPGRRMVVISRQPDFRPEGVQVVHSLEAALAAAPPDEQELFIGGGAEIYRQAMELTDRIYLTIVERDVEGDAYFPPVDLSGWTLVEEEAHVGAEEPLPYRFLTYDRRS